MDLGRLLRTAEPYLFRPASATCPFSPCLAGFRAGGGRAPFSSLPPDSCPVCADRQAGSRVAGRDREATPQAPLTCPAGCEGSGGGGGEGRGREESRRPRLG